MLTSSGLRARGLQVSGKSMGWAAGVARASCLKSIAGFAGTLLCLGRQGRGLGVGLLGFVGENSAAFRLRCGVGGRLKGQSLLVGRFQGLGLLGLALLLRLCLCFPCLILKQLGLHSMSDTIVAVMFAVSRTSLLSLLQITQGLHTPKIHKFCLNHDAILNVPKGAQCPK